jgi:histone-binding protein RBBP4
MSIGVEEEEDEIYEEFHLEYVQEQTFEENAENKQILEEFAIWKCDMPFLFDLIITRALECPSLTVQWIPIHDQSLHKILLGT